MVGVNRARRRVADGEVFGDEGSCGDDFDVGFRLDNRAVADPAICAKISTTRARIAGLSDRVGLGTGQRADLVAVNMETHRVEMTLCHGRLAHLSGALAAKVWARLG
ncbi:MAG: hypothetical protein ACEQSU_05345 [Microgenomates group bacterium]